MTVLDTNVVSELMHPTPDAAVRSWVRQQPPHSLVTTAITVAEVRFGIARLPAGQRRERLSLAAAEVFLAFAERVWPFDVAAAGQYADIVAARESLGRPIDGFDAQIAAVCRARGASLATRNVRDFQDLSLQVVDPWGLV